MNIKKILVANRGEIADRIIQTCKRLGIQTVAVYSEADEQMPYVKAADEAFLIGPPPAFQSYLKVDEILNAALTAKVDAIHPGYGFLSENSNFVDRCEKEGIVFIGPSSEVIKMMGSKIEARKRMKELGVPVVPGSIDAIGSVEEAIQLANYIGYPVMLKASAGGGGIGMELVYSDMELEKAFTSTKSRSEKFFGDSAIFIEKYIENPRHIEVQIAIDSFGNAVHLFERECSVQRRHQKVMEESPSPSIDSSQWEELKLAALKGAAGIGYHNLGTMEFIFDDQGNFYFLEMNTRLQVEHPVTEEITGLDLVEWQIEIANQRPLPSLQENIQRKGHAMECRIYAEDPVRFFPSPGKITELVWPDNIRIDTAIRNETTITPFYDPMIAKIVVKGTTREESIQKMKTALLETKITGIKTNIPLLVEVLENKEFQSGFYSTNLVNKMRNNTVNK
ncbi:acetyl/propionyl/methylcrotonyl-CoA carboxylase subunit alpha [Neobacillus sp. NPDC097160]|uniref:acetyl-CoA carboxylase biotin carboxylase subunit n=1 Tax=Neobacillus sp. NPDC097160 TaxID=3364298 RepID=UPI003806B2F7